MKHRILPTIALASPLLLFGACIFVVDGDGHVRHGLHIDDDEDWGLTEGSGISKTESRTVTDFRRIVVEGSADLSVRVGDATSVNVTGDDNIISYVTTEVRDGSLVIGMKRGSYSTRVDLTIAVTTPGLDALSIQGSSDAELSGITGESFSAQIFGSGDVRASGKVDRLDAAISGSGDLRLDGLESREVKVGISGSGDVEVWATEMLVASISGSGDVRYRGEPKVTKSVAGSGSVAPR
ncbi:MAG: head GIN domain-containing protein [Planctomycetota bacterium]